MAKPTPVRAYSSQTLRAGNALSEITNDPELKAAALANLGVESGSGITELVDDTSPQLGGDLDANGHEIIGYTPAADLGALAFVDTQDFSQLNGLVGFSQIDRTTTVVSETATVTIAANTKIKVAATGTLTTIAFSGGNNVSQSRVAEIDFGSGLSFPFTLTVPTCRRLGETGSTSSVVVASAGVHWFVWEYIDSEYILADSVEVASSISDTAYNASAWNGVTDIAPSKNSVRDKIEDLRIQTIGAVIDGAGSAITTGRVKGFFTSPYAGTISAWSISVDAGTLTFTVWKVATGAAVPTISNLINTSGLAISTGTHVRSTIVTDFTSTAVSVGDIFAFVVTATSGPTEATLQLEVTR